MGTSTQQNLKQAEIGQRVPVRLPWRFVANGASNPTSFSTSISSVVRATADGPGDAIYRVTLAESWGLSRDTTVWLAITITTKNGQNITASYGQGYAVSAVTADGIRTFDVVVRTANTGTALNNLSDNIISGEILVDQAVTV